MRVASSLAVTSLYTLLFVLHTNAAPVIPADCRCCKDKSVHVFEPNVCGDVGIASPCQQLRPSQLKSRVERALLEKLSCNSFSSLRPRSKLDPNLPLLQSLTSTIEEVARASQDDIEDSNRASPVEKRKEMRTLRICSWEQLKEHIESIARLLLDSPEKVVVGGIFCFFVVGAVLQSLREAEAWSRRRRPVHEPRAAAYDDDDDDDELPSRTNEVSERPEKLSLQIDNEDRRSLKLEIILEEDEAA